MKKTIFLLILFFSAFLAESSRLFAAQADSLFDPDRRYTSAPKTITDLEDERLRALRLLQHRQQMEMLQEQGESDPRRVSGSVTPAVPVLAAAVTTEATKAYEWLVSNQASSPLGLVESYPQDSNANQGFTYDQALAGIAMLKNDDDANAAKIFNFYNSQWDGTGFWTVYNTQAIDGSKIEYAKVLGPNAWIAIFAMTYYKETGDGRGLDLATSIGHWIRSLPHQDGGVAMGVDNPGSNPNWGTIYSVENNIDYLAVLELLVKKATLTADRALFQTELTNLKTWFQTKAYDSASGLIKRGPSNSINDMTMSLDTNTWAISVLGVDGIKQLFGWNDSQLIAYVGRVENAFAIQNDGTFGGNIGTAKGFDFAYAQNAQMIQDQGFTRPGIKWVEGTNQMILVYKQLADYFTLAGNTTEAQKYQTRADYFLGLNAANVTGDGKSYFYTDRSGTKVFWDVPFWNAAPGAAVASTSWVYFAAEGINPFNPFAPRALLVPVSIKASTVNTANQNLSVDIDLNYNATVVLGGLSLSGMFDTETNSILLENLSTGSGASDEDWRLYFDETVTNGFFSYSLKSMNKLLLFADTSLYNYGYNFLSDGLLGSDSYYYTLGANNQVSTRLFTYTQVNSQTLLDVETGSTYFNGEFGYATNYDNDYDLTGRRTTTLMTQEVRNNLSQRILMTYRQDYAVDGTITLTYLGSQII